MKHLKNFESFGVKNELEVNEELFGFGSKVSKAIKKFKNDNKEDFSELKSAENNLKKDDSASAKRLGDIQKKLLDKLDIFVSKDKGELFDLLKIDKVDSDWKTVKKDIRDIITNISPYEKRGLISRISGGSGSGRR